MSETIEIQENGVQNNGYISDKEEKKQSTLPRERKVSYVEDTGNEPAKSDTKVELQSEGFDRLLYKTSETPPIHLLLLFAFQQFLMSISGTLAVVLIASKVICAGDDEEFVAYILSSSLCMNGVCTILMNTIGVRLPLYQGAYGGYILPLLTLLEIDPNKCKVRTTFQGLNSTNASLEITVSEESQLRGVILRNMRELQGCLMLVGVIHMLMGATGLIGVLLRFIGPVTVVPTILLLGIAVVDPILDFCVPNWGISTLVTATGFVLAFYLAKYNMPVAVWTPKGGCRVVKYPLHQVFAILISIVIGWVVSWIITEAGGFTDDKTDKGYKARTDARLKGISAADWFFFPYPGLHGPVSYSTPVFLGFLIATFLSILDSIGDYYACASMSHVPPPPQHAVNRGIMVEGIGTILSGAVGATQATTTYGGNIGSIGVTRVASRSVFIGCGILLIIFGLFGKLSALFISIPYPVLGGSLITMIGMFIGVTLSNLRPISLTSSRNLAIIGTSILIGLLIPEWVKKYGSDIDTGYQDVDFSLKGLFGNSNFVCGILSCFLDNTVPGTLEERGIAAWQSEEEEESTKSLSMTFEEGKEIYEIPLPRKIKMWSGWRYIPFMPDPKREKKERSLSVSALCFGR
ncbi:solute carrier family 23 member 1-like isoform X2 [Saccostrea echinata]|uniref:solute carrier family 23 member 1-like isoform X2 n=1 Tax=Saccostrea echinata TaxID=191078 RepID=UPI002A7FC55B|nr:solute carrier family 23 member 1-like isoform X2 [Saccostrea echinata]